METPATAVRATATKTVTEQLPQPQWTSSRFLIGVLSDKNRLEVAKPVNATATEKALCKCKCLIHERLPMVALFKVFIVMKATEVAVVTKDASANRTVS